MKMKKQLFLVGAIISIAFFVQAQNLNLEKLGQLSYDQELSDIWAYSSEDSTGVNEYALVGLFNGLSIVDVTNPAEPLELHYIEGVGSTWRDMKTYNGFAYVSNETGSGILIVNLNNLPEEAPSINFTGDENASFTTAHNVFVDEMGFLYVIGSNYGNGGCLIFDLNEDPLSPRYAGVYDETYVHDAYARDNKLYTSEVYGGIFSIVDVSDKSNPVILGNASTPSNFTHNCWLSDDGNTLFTTDERSSAFIGAYDISDYTDIKELYRIQSNPGSGVIPHNTHVLNDYLITSYYSDGVTIHDASQPGILVEVGNFDTSPNFSGNGFNGSWGATPFLPSGNILASDIEEGLFILKPTYKRAAFLIGVVSDSDTSEPLSDVTVTLLNTEVVTASNSEGNYVTGLLNSSSVEVQFSKPGYETQIVSYELVAEQTDTLAISLQAATSFAISVNVYDKEDGNQLSDAKISIANADFTFDETSNESGELMINEFYEGEYYVYVGKWGYQTIADTINFTENRKSYSANLDRGYYDDFTLDFGWQVSGDALRGVWQQGEPIGTTFRGDVANPENDSDSDISNVCFTTGNGGGGAGDDDVDDGRTILTSPVFDLSNIEETDMIGPTISYERWFFNDGGNGPPPNDSLTIYLSNGMDSVILETVNADSEVNGSWQQSKFVLADFDIELTNTMTIIAETADDTEAGHLVEAAFDHFYVEGIKIIVDVINHTYHDLSVQLSENPFTEQIQLTLNDAFQQLNNQLTIQFISVDGKVLETQAIKGQNISWGSQAAKGIYQYIISNKEGYLYSGKLIKL